jgi:ribosomal protein S18 acetylase RimI-like enzyme
MTTIRPARPDEYDRVGELTVAVYRALPVDHLWGGYEAEILDTAGRAKAADIIVAVENDVIAGTTTFVADHGSPWSEWTEPGEAQFRLLVVDPAARGHGVGELLVRDCMTRADGRPIVIHTTKWMPAAQRMYDRLGFVRRPDRDVAYDEWLQPEWKIPSEWIGEPFLAFAYNR